ncbi:MAG: sigma-54 dependent transcriptional regulator [Nitrospirota bacterium]
METILLIEDLESLAKMLTLALEKAGFHVVLARDGAEGIAKIKEGGMDLVVTDLKLPKKTGMDVLHAVREYSTDIPVVLMTAYGSIETAVLAIKEGAADFITKPFDPDHLILQINKGLEKKRLLTENLILKESLTSQIGFPKIIGKSQAIFNATEKMRKVAEGKTTVLLLGESGTGKDIFARALHLLSPRRDKLLVSINCAAIPKDLLESELFGHERGAFTGAVSRKIGRFELADKGTLFLDEIGDMELTLQAKLLRVLEEGEVMRVGGTTNVKIDVRLIAATNQDLLDRVAQKTFREDLYHRLAVFSILIPPLRERREDLPALVDHFITKIGKTLKKNVHGISDAAMRQLNAHPFTGNIRELQNCIERAIILSEEEMLQPQDLGLTAMPIHEDPISISGGLQEASRAAIVQVESRIIRQVLSECSGNKSRAAEKLQVSYKTLLTKIKAYKLE